MRSHIPATASSSTSNSSSRFPAPPGQNYYQLTAIDDCTRLRVLRIYPKVNQQTAIQFLDYLLERLPFRVGVIQTDNGVEFGSSFHWHVLDQASATSTSSPAPRD